MYLMYHIFMARDRNLKPVEEDFPYGVYVWEMPDGSIVSDDEGRRMNIQAKRGDQRRIDELRKAALSFGVETGAPLFVPAGRPVTDEEYDRQQFRLSMGLLPDDQGDIPALLEEMKHRAGD
jgi:hypothetical protein